MKRIVRQALGILLTSTTAGLLIANAHAAELDARTIIARSLNAFYYAGDDMRARVTMRLINAQGKERKRVMAMLRKNIADGGEQRYYIYFHAPSDVKGTSFMVWKYLQKEDDRWIFIPAIKLVRRIAADDKRSSFVGSDFTYEDVSGRAVDDESHSLLRTEELDGRPVYVLESKPKAKTDYERRVSWIDQERWLPLKEEYFDARGEKVRVFSADRVEQLGGQWTVTARTMKNLQTGHRTETRFDQVKYGIRLQQGLFSERYLRNPPRKWIR
jgi:outer membrane lipoprotein-sorting protein